MLGRKASALPRQTKQTSLSFGPPAKRQKFSPPAEDSLQVRNEAPVEQKDDSYRDARESPSRHRPPVRYSVPDSDAEGDEAEDIEELQTETQQTDLEQALAPIKTDKEAIEEYEAMRAAQNEQRERRLDSGEWVKGKSSIYVDAFNLALDTVLEEESHLFDAAELKVFEDWRKLDYEYQYLYVLFGCPLRS